MKDIRVSIAVPSTQTWDADFGMSLIFLSTFLAANAHFEGKQMAYVIQNKRGSILANMRERLIQNALANDATHLLFLDSDQTFPRDTLHRLLARKKQIVAANVATKMLPPSPTARQYDPANYAGIPAYTRPESTGLEQVWRVGTGIMLIDLNLFKRPGMEEPWFEQHWNPEQKTFTGEDWSFCAKLEKAGVKLWVDHDLSKEVGHVGKLNYGHDMIVDEEMQEAV